jgi:hypothetical protein
MKKTLVALVCCIILYSCKKSDNTTPKTPDKNFLIEISCTELCNIQVDTALSDKSFYPTFDKQDNIRIYKNSLDATGGQSLVSIHVYDSKTYTSPSPKSIKLTYKGRVLYNESYPATASFIVRGLIPIE